MILSIHILKNICHPAVAGDGGGPNERKRMAGYSPAASQTKDQG